VRCSGDTGGVVTELSLARNNRGRVVSFIAALDTKGVLPAVFSTQARPPAARIAAQTSSASALDLWLAWSATAKFFCASARAMARPRRRAAPVTKAHP
jgi:hypothetical protein